MANYYNPYLSQGNYGTGGIYGQAYSGYVPAQQSYAAPQATAMPYNYKVMEYVDGEIGAIAYQLPPGWPPNVFFPVWDNKTKTIYFKSINPMGAPNPIQKAHYEFETTPSLPEGNVSGDAQVPDMSQYVTKQDFDQLREDMQKLLNQNNNNFRNSKSENVRGDNR